MKTFFDEEIEKFPATSGVDWFLVGCVGFLFGFGVVALFASNCI